MFTWSIRYRIYTAVLVLFIVIYSYLLYIGMMSGLIYFLLMGVSVWCATLVYLVTYQKKEIALLRLMNECKIAEFIEKYHHEHAKDSKKGYTAGATIHMATAYMHLGDLETSLELFQRVELQDPKKVKRKMLPGVIINNALYHNNLSTAYLRQHDIENAKLHIKKAKAYFKQLQWLKDKKGRNKDNIEAFTRSLANRDLELGLEFGLEVDYAENIERLKQYVDETKTLLNRVYFYYLLFVLYEKTGDAEEADKCREYVRENGGDTCYVQWVEN